jgi:hypothetical protein
MINKTNTDWRDIKHGNVIPSEQYTDQPYIIKTNDGAWLCTLTTGTGCEGQKGQHVVTYRSYDKGKSWQDYCELETGDGPESAYSVLLKVPGGRVFAFYNYNSDNIREVPADPGPTFNGSCWRVDCLGDFVFRYSDDHGRTWSKQRYIIDVREMEIDRNNCFGGKVRFFWNVGKAFFHNNCAYVPLIKIGGFGEGCYTKTEGVLLKCCNISFEAPENLSWETLPDGEFGLKTPFGGGPISEEHSFSVLSDGSFFCVYRTIDGHPACCYSRDEGHTWTEPQYMRYADGRKIKHPRAANFAWKCSNGKFLYWFENHGGKDFEDRNPAWVCGGIEADSPTGRVIQWTQPEILLYDNDPLIAMSYPDLLEDEGLYISETQKKTARLHLIDQTFLKKLWNQFEPSKETAKDYLFMSDTPGSHTLPELPNFVKKNHSFSNLGTEKLNNGITIEFTVNTEHLSDNTILLDNRTLGGVGFCVMFSDYNRVKIMLNDGVTENHWESDPNSITANEKTHHVAIVIDGGSNTISFVIDGKFNDGAAYRQFGWGRLSPALRQVNGDNQLKVYRHISTVRIYSRALMTSEVINNYQAEKLLAETKKINIRKQKFELSSIN